MLEGHLLPSPPPQVMSMDEVNEWSYTSITPYAFPDTFCGQTTENGAPAWFLHVAVALPQNVENYGKAFVKFRFDKRKKLI